MSRVDPAWPLHPPLPRAYSQPLQRATNPELDNTISEQLLQSSDNRNQLWFLHQCREKRSKCKQKAYPLSFAGNWQQEKLQRKTRPENSCRGFLALHNGVKVKQIEIIRYY